MIAISSINSIIDGVIASNFVSTTALAVIALFMPVVKILETINTIFLSGSQILCGQYIGKNQVKRSEEVFSTDLFFIFMIGLAGTLICFLFARPIASLFANDELLIKELSDYIYGYSFGIIPMMFIPQLTAFLQMERQEKRTYIGMACMIILNISLDIVFVSVFDLGMLGLGLATTVGNLAFFLVMVSFYFFGKSSIRFDVRSVRPAQLVGIVRVGFPGAVSQLGQTFRAILLNMIMLRFIGNEGVSAFSAVNSFGSLYYAVTAGVSTSARVLASIYVGEEDRAGLHEIMKTALIKGTALISAVAAVCIACAPLFTRIFYGPESGAVYGMTLAGFIIFPISMPFSCICCVFSNYYQCLDRIKVVNILMFFDGLVGIIIFSWLLAPVIGMTGVWIAQVINGVLTLAVIVVYTCLFNRRFPHSIADLLVLRDSFGVSEENRIDIQITDMKDVINLSKSIIDFAKAHSIDDHRSMVAGLCIEEMAGNIVIHGFDGKKNYNIDVRVIYKDEGLLIRLKDNCRTFNPKEVGDLFDPADITHNVGLRIVSNIASSMTYNNCLGINILNISIN